MNGHKLLRNMRSIYEKFSSIRTRTAVIVLFAVGFLVYGNILKSPFLWDDKSNITGNTFITDWKYLPEYFSQNIFAGANNPGDYWRPLELVSFSLDYRISGLSTTTYHLDNIFWHILAAILLYIILLKLFNNRAAGLLTALVFLVHPLQIEAVTYISGRADSMSTVFILASFLFFWKYANEKPHLMNFLTSIVFFILALLSHERSVVFPAIILLYLFTLYHEGFLVGWKKKILASSPFLLIGILYIVSRLTILHFSNSFDIGAPTFIGNFILANSKAIAIYAGLLVFPAKLYVEKSVSTPTSFFDIYVIAGMALFLISAVGFFLSLKKKRIFAFCIGWFWIFLSISLYAYPSMGMLWEHWLYLPMIGLWMLIFIIVTEKIGKTNSLFIKIGMIIIIFAFIAGLSIRTIVRNNDWNDTIRFFEKNIANGGISERVYNELGTAYEDAGRDADALSTYQKSADLNDQLYQPWYNMGTIYEYEGDLDQAIANYSRVIQIEPSFLPAYSALAEIAVKKNNLDGAIVIYRETLDMYPQNVEAILNIGALYFQKGNPNKAREYFKEAKQLDPNNQNIDMALDKLDSLEKNPSDKTK
jgi:protein O-mannosyl-transferase